MKIIADENIPHVEQYFSVLGEVMTVNGRLLNTEQVRDADILLVRSVTCVDESLLKGSSVKFVASATIGMDHIDTAYLDSKGITYCNAPGCNADSVVDYVVSVLCTLEGAFARLLSGAQVGIVGFGNVGSRLYHRLRALGVTCAVYDPLLPRERCDDFASLDEVLAADIVCCHAPLTKQGSFPTEHMLSVNELSSLKPNAVLINAGRGAVIDGSALLSIINARPDIQVALDVWEHEPCPDPVLLSKVDVATPHIAGYSYDGKLAGTQMIFKACLAFLGDAVVKLPEMEDSLIEIVIDEHALLEEAVGQAVLASYAVSVDDSALRQAIKRAESSEQAGLAFDRLRKNYPVRREYSRYRIGNSAQLAPDISRYLSALGFEMSR